MRCAKGHVVVGSPALAVPTRNAKQAARSSRKGLAESCQKTNCDTLVLHSMEHRSGHEPYEKAVQHARHGSVETELDTPQDPRQCSLFDDLEPQRPLVRSLELRSEPLPSLYRGHCGCTIQALDGMN